MRVFRLFGLLLLPVLCALARAEGSRGVRIRDVLPATTDVPVYQALIVGINEYREMPPLAYAESDARRVADVLRENYGFRTIVTLTGDRATRAAMDAAIRKLLDGADNRHAVFVFYAGHGYAVEAGDHKGGYWIPHDGRKPGAADAPASWIAHADIKRQAGASRARHVFLVSDSCFAGEMARGLGTPASAADAVTGTLYSRQIANPSRYLLTSGNSEEVPDKSFFAEQFINQLTSSNIVLSAHDIARAVAQPVFERTAKQVVFGEMPELGGRLDGNFIFIQDKPVRPEALLVLHVTPPGAGVSVAGALDHTQASIVAGGRAVAEHRVRVRANERARIVVRYTRHVTQSWTETPPPGLTIKPVNLVFKQPVPPGL